MYVAHNRTITSYVFLGQKSSPLLDYERWARR